jgi:F5/8 type C domain-containing protein
MSGRRSAGSRSSLSGRVGPQGAWCGMCVMALAALLIATVAAAPAFAQARKTPPPTRAASQASASIATQAPAHVLDRLDDVGAWKTVASEGVTASLQAVVEARRPALRLDFDLGGTAGYAIARRALPLDLPENYAITFWLRADAPVNDLQVKLIDASGDNVWWYHRPNFAFPSEWQQVTIKKRQIDFAWGPTKDHVLRHVASIEIVVAAGAGGGRGAIYLSDLALQELPETPATWPAPKATASSSSRGSEALYALDGDTRTAWRSDPKARREQWLTVDFGAPREFGGLTLRFAPGEQASRYDVQFSDDAKHWRTVRRVTEGTASAALLLSESETRYLRLAFHDGPKRGYALTELTVEDLAFGASPNAFVAALARTTPRGTYPRAFSGEQGAWTLVGVDGGNDSGLLSEDGALEIGRNGFTVEPFVIERGKTVAWPDVDSQPFLVDDDLPIPGVQWNAHDWSLRITTFGIGTEDDVRLVARYDVINKTDHPLTLALALAVRPFQVNPPSQSLNAPGGVSPITSLEWNGRALTVNGARTVFPLSVPARVTMQAFDAGPLVSALAATDSRPRRELHDDSGFASGAMIFPVTLAAQAGTTLGIVVPLADRATAPALTGRTPLQWLAREQATAAAGWRGKLDRVTLRVPPEAQPLADALHTTLAHILITRNGPTLRPGTRSYARSWIRDGTMIAETLLRLGHDGIAADYLRWYAPHQFANGKIPCCVDARGSDPVPENDSPGQFIFLAAEIYRYTQDRVLLEQMWPRLEAAAGYMETLRQSERVEPAGFRKHAATFGLMPASISHEGYSAKPMHSFWDDFWALKGYAGIVSIAEVLGNAEAARRFATARDEFRQDLIASLKATAAGQGIDYLPGSVELGDFDPTSTTIAFAPAGDPDVLPRELIKPTFERYWKEFIARRDGTANWTDYTPYELRNVSTFVRLGWRNRAQELLDFFMAGRRPRAWNQWPEVVARDTRTPVFIGDLPHAWVASDYIRSILDLFAYERSDRAIVLAGGVPAAWLDRAGVAIRGLRTPYGTVSYSLVRTDERIAELTLSASGRVPPGGFVLAGPWRPVHAIVNGKSLVLHGDELRIDELEAKVVLQFSR